MPPASHQVSATSLKLLIQQIHHHVRVERDSGMCVARDLYELWGRSPYTRMFVARVRGVVKVVLCEHLPKPTRREEVPLRRGSKHEVAQDTVYISRPERPWIRPWRWCRRRQQRSCWGGTHVHPEKGIFYAQRARTRSLLNTCQTMRATCHERQATSASLWPSGVGGRRPPPFLLHCVYFLLSKSSNISALNPSKMILT
jgi:hypothetical protein